MLSQAGEILAAPGTVARWIHDTGVLLLLNGSFSNRLHLRLV